MIPLHNRNFACKYYKHLCNNKGAKHRQFILILPSLQEFIQDRQVEIYLAITLNAFLHIQLIIQILEWVPFKWDSLLK